MDKGRSDRSESIKSWPPRTAWGEPISKWNKKGFIFDHLWGIPGGLNKQDLLLLRCLDRRRKLEQRVPYLILDEHEIAENRDRCCNNAFGRTAREYTWHTGLHGFKYIAYCRRHVPERIVWALICVLGIVLGIYFSVRAADFYYGSESVFVTANYGNRHVPFPDSIRFCSSVKSVTKRRSNLEEKFPPLTFLWKTWDRILEGTQDNFDDLSDFWADIESPKIRQLLQQTMIEGGAVMGAPTCQDVAVKCRTNDGVKDMDCCSSKSIVTLTRNGPCFDIHFRTSMIPKSTDQVLGDYVAQARNELRFSIRLSGTASSRVGYPIVNMTYWGVNHLCGESWDVNEANVMCKSLGFHGGARYFMDTGPVFPSRNILGKLMCSGKEGDLTQCPFSYKNYDGHSLTTCKSSTPVAVLCDPGSLHHGSNFQSRIQGKPYLTDHIGKRNYFCSEQFTNSEATVFCNMMSWKYGKVKVVPDDAPTASHYTNTKCTGTEAHILDCSHTYNADPTSCQSVFIQCDPGFAMTLDIYNPLSSPQSIEFANWTIGYPTINIPDNNNNRDKGYICGVFEDDVVPSVMCRTLGYPFGTRLSNRIFSKRLSDPIFVLKQIVCTGDEDSIFDCDLGIWGNHGNSDGNCSDPLAILCSKNPIENEKLFEPVFLDSVDYTRLDTIDTPNALVALETYHGYVPLCNDDLWSDFEANVLCSSKGFQCGMANRRISMQIPINRRRFPQLLPFFAKMRCSFDGDECLTQLSGGCDSGEGVSAMCINEDDVEYSNCVLLREGVSNSVQDEVLVSFFLPPLESDDNHDGNCNQEGYRIFVGDREISSIHRGDSITATISATTTSTSDQILRWIPNERDRKCRSSFDRDECNRQCKDIFVKTVCQCLPWYRIRSVDNFEEVCTGKGMTCLNKIKRALTEVSRNFSIAVSLTERAGLWRTEYRNGSFLYDMCQCPESCDNQIDYTIKSVQVREICQSRKFGSNAEFKLILDKSLSVHYVRHTMFVWEYLLGIIGGIMAIFIGFSFITLIEIVYFFTVRLWENNEPLPPSKDTTMLADWCSEWRNERRKMGEKRANSDPDLTKKDEFWRELEKVEKTKIEQEKEIEDKKPTKKTNNKVGATRPVSKKPPGKGKK